MRTEKKKVSKVRKTRKMSGSIKRGKRRGEKEGVVFINPSTLKAPVGTHPGQNCLADNSRRKGKVRSVGSVAEVM